MDPEIKALLDDLGFTAEERTQAETLFGSRSDKVKKAMSAQSSYSRNMDQLKTLKAGLATKEASIEDDFARVAQFEAKMGEVLGTSDVTKVAPALQTLLTERETLRTQATALEAELRKQAQEYGFEFKVPAGTTPNPNPNPGPGTRTVDTSRFVTRDDVANDLRTTYPQVAAQIHDLSIQHQKLFGTPLENASELVALSMQSAQDAIRFRDPSREKSPQQIWAEKFNVPAKQAEIAVAAEEARFQVRLAEDRIKRASQQASPVPNSGIPGSPVIGHKFAPVVEAGKTVNVTDQNRGVAAAMANFGANYGNAT